MLGTVGNDAERRHEDTAVMTTLNSSVGEEKARRQHEAGSGQTSAPRRPDVNRALGGGHAATTDSIAQTAA